MPKLAEQIRLALAQRDGVSEAAMRPLAVAYANEVARVNERLSNAVALLHKGLRSEAIQSASLAPNAIDAAASLDFPEFDEWCEILKFLAIPVPQDLNRDLADQLGEAIVDEQPLQGLLKQHRRLAIARAPLGWRLKILRRIAEIDATNGVWEDDIEIWETARIKQLFAEVPAAVARHDVPQLRTLQQELTLSPWRITPEASLINQVAAALQQLNDETVGDELATIAPLLHDAFCQFDEPAAREALSRWNAARTRTTASIGPELLEQIEGPLAWLAEIDRETSVRRERSAAIGRLESALDVHQDRNRIQAAFNACQRFDEPPPVELVTRYRLALERFDLVDKRRNQSVIAAVAAVTLLAVGSIIYWQLNAVQERNVVAAVEQMQAMVASTKIDDAQSFWAVLSAESPGVAADPRLQALATKLASLAEAEANRVLHFANYLSLADVGESAQMDFSSLAKAEALASTEDEKAGVFKVRRRYQAWDLEIDAAQSKSLLADVNSIQDQLDAIEKMQADEALQQDLAFLDSKLTDSLSRHPRANSAAKSRVKFAKSRLSSLRDALRDRRDRMSAESDAMNQLAKAASFEELARRLESFAVDAPGLPVAKELSLVFLERAHWGRAAQWNAFANSVAKALESGLTSDNTTDLIAEEKTVQTSIGSNIADDESGTWKARILRYPERMEILKRVLGELPETVVADLYTFIESEGSGNRYFTYKTYHERNRQKFQEARVGLEIVINDSGAVKNELLSGPFKIIEEPHSTIWWLSGLHMAVGSSFGTDWEGELLKTMGQLRTRPGLDSQVKEMLVMHLLAGACEGSEWLSKNLASELSLLRTRSKDRQFWYEPAKLNDSLDPEIASKVILTAAGLYRSRPQAAADIRALRRLQYNWVGILLRDNSGKIEASITKTPADDGRLVVARPSLGDTAKTDFIPVGRLVKGKPNLDPGKADLIAGRPLFFVPN